MATEKPKTQDGKDIKDTTTVGSTVSKTKELIEAARKRNEIEQANADAPVGDSRPQARFSDEELDQLKADAEIMAEGKVQAKAGTLDGSIDVEAMGDVKGDGGDAKNYDDDDPAKGLGVPTYIHGLHETKGGAETSLAPETRISARTAAEQARGKEVLQGHSEARARAQKLSAQSGETRKSRTVVTDAEEDEATIRAKVKAREDAEKASK